MVFLRILNLIALRNHLPRWASARRGHNDELQIELAIDSFTEHESFLLGKKIENIPTVIRVCRHIGNGGNGG